MVALRIAVVALVRDSGVMFHLLILDLPSAVLRAGYYLVRSVVEIEIGRSHSRPLEKSITSSAYQA